MSLQVIGAGWGRTGTESLKQALEMLGYTKCFHMFELIINGDRLKYFEQLERQETPDFETLFEGYTAGVDFPVAAYYKELMNYYPDAKVILTIRDADKWYDSASKTIFRPIPGFILFTLRLLGFFSNKIGYFPKVFTYAKRAFLDGLFEGKIYDREVMKEKLTRWNREVMQYVPEERLLVYDVREGWEPLCAFLAKPIPEKAFPKANDSNAFLQRLKLVNIIKTQIEK